MDSVEQVIILGTGCAGLTAAIYAARANLNPLVIEGGQPGGQLTTTTEVENFPGFPEGVDGFMLMDQMRKQAAKFGTRFVNDRIEAVDLSGDVRVLKSGSKEYRTRSLIVSTGASPRMLGVPGEQALFGGKGVTTCATCDGAFYRGQKVVVVGGGDTAVEEAIFLTRFASKVTVIHRRDELRASAIMAERLLKTPKIEMAWNTVVEEVLAGDDGKARAVQVKDTETGETREIPARGVFIAIGHVPNTQPFQGQLAMDDEGYFVPESPTQVRTQVPGVYVAGDCADHVYRQAITAAGMGCQAAIEAERWLGENDYGPDAPSSEADVEATASA
ncbi:MAG: thioredoxin-disulfide reductase [Opitutales bacterium]